MIMHKSIEFSTRGGFWTVNARRLVGVGSMDIFRPVEATREVRRCVRELGFKAIRVLP